MATQSKKGISPLIATVLLVVFTIAVGTTIFTWTGQYTSDALDKANQVSKVAVDCSKQGVNIVRVFATTAQKNITKIDVSSTGTDPVPIQRLMVSTSGNAQCSYNVSGVVIAPGNIHSFLNQSCPVTCTTVDNIRVSTFCGSASDVITNNASIVGC